MGHQTKTYWTTTKNVSSHRNEGGVAWCWMVLHGVAGTMVTEGIGGDMGLKVRQLRDEVRRYCKS